MNSVKDNIASNLTRLRKENNLTQSELAQKLNYTDKSVSKWEHGESVPPIETLKELAELYGVTIDYLVQEFPEDLYNVKIDDKKTSTNKLIIALLSTSIVWFLATFLYVNYAILQDKHIWIFFVWAVPVSAIVLLVFNCLWGKRTFTYILISIIVWSFLACLYLTFIQYNMWLIFTLGVPPQVATILWYNLKPRRKNKKASK
jgi:transcriptional regulator with XRE-family HTH domain